ncbi:MAG: site-specific integrase [Oscillospiraceae bacterium]|nr:site-specific integrase [Oscillospiraceae bacterium]
MASIKKTTDSRGAVVYKVQASSHGKRVTKSWRPEPSWSAKTTERELAKFAANLENELAAGTLQTRGEKIEAAKIAAAEAAKVKTFEQYANGVFMPSKALVLAENTRLSYQLFLDLHILPVLGDFALPEINSAMIGKLLLDFQRNHAYSSTLKFYVLLSSVFKMAYLNDVIENNPMLKVPRPQPKRGEKTKSEPTSYSVREVQYIFKCLENEPLKWRCFIHVLADSGMRRGEAAALMWQDIDFKNSTIEISKNLQYSENKGGVYITVPKSGKGRVVDIGFETLSLLRQLRLEQSERAISAFCFTRGFDAQPMSPQNVSAYFRKFGEKYNVKNFHPHALRHTCASISLLGGGDVTSVSRRLGHSNVSITLNTYSHVNFDDIRNAGNVLRAALDKAEGE